MHSIAKQEALDALGKVDPDLSPAERCVQVDDEPITDDERASIWLDVMNKVDIDGIPF